MFYEVEPGEGYTIRGDFGDGEVSTAPVTVLNREDTPPTTQYTGQTFTPGLNYIKMRDGIEIAMTLRLPAGKTLADGPFPTVIEYSGYEVAPPNDLLSSMAAQIADPSAKADPLAPSGSTAVGSLIAPLLGYATVSVQIRGSGCSGGAFDLFGLPTIYDGYDAVETVAAQPWVAHNKVGMVGIS
ncbi:MAG: peptidase S15, partial [Actinobacteria bacterium]|nr:peptidase S15 [Actinomycetota bacterium]